MAAKQRCAEGLRKGWPGVSGRLHLLVHICNVDCGQPGCHNCIEGHCCCPPQVACCSAVARAHALAQAGYCCCKGGRPGLPRRLIPVPCAKSQRQRRWRTALPSAAGATLQRDLVAASRGCLGCPLRQASSRQHFTSLLRYGCQGIAMPAQQVIARHTALKHEPYL